MKIYILPVPEWLQPETQGFIWPPGCEDYGVEQDWHRWLSRTILVTDNPHEAAWHYLPIYWNRWFLTNDDRSGRGRFNDDIQAAILERERTFVVAEYDPLGLQPDVDLSGLTIFTANRMADNGTIDIPLLLHEHELPFPGPKRLLASFVGHLDTHPIRREMEDALRGQHTCYVTNEPHGIDDFVRVIQESYVALAPRGDGAQSFRFYEAMQAGVVPLYLSDIDARPFQSWIDWDSMSFFLDNVTALPSFLATLDRQELLQMGRLAQRTWYQHLRYGAWCPYLLRELEKRRQ